MCFYIYTHTLLLHVYAGFLIIIVELSRTSPLMSLYSFSLLQEAALTGNPLLTPSATSQVKRRWNDDVVFRNQSRGEPEKKKRFINDTIRSDFHKKFLWKYIQ